MALLINPRRACAARVTVLGLSVSQSVCLSTTILALQAAKRHQSDTNSYSATKAIENKNGDFAKTKAFEIDHVACTSPSISGVSTRTRSPGPCLQPLDLSGIVRATSRRMDDSVCTVHCNCHQRASNWLCRQVK